MQGDLEYRLLEALRVLRDREAVDLRGPLKSRVACPPSRVLCGVLYVTLIGMFLGVAGLTGAYTHPAVHLRHA